MTEDMTHPPGAVPPRQRMMPQPTPPRRAEERTDSRKREPELDRPTPVYGAMPYGQALYPLCPPGAEHTVNIGRILQVLWRHKWLPLLCMAATVAGTVWYLRTTEPVYESSALVELSVRRPRIMRQEDALIEEQGRVSADELYNTQIMKLRGATLRDRVTQAMHAKAGTPPDTLANWLNSVEIDLVRKSSLVKITARHTTPVMAAELANAYANEAVANALAENRTLSDEAVRWLRVQAETQRSELEAIEVRLLHFRNEQKLNTLDAQQTMTRDALLNVNAELTSTRTALTKHVRLLEHLRPIAKREDPTDPLPAATPGRDDFSNLLASLRNLRSEKEALLQDYTSRHPLVLDKDAQIQSTLDGLKSTVRRALGTVLSDVKILKDQADALGARKNALTADLADIEHRLRIAQNEQSALERQRDASRISYQGVLNRIEEARLSADEQTATIKVVEAARPSKRPSRPRPLRLFALAVLLGGALGAGMVFLAETLQDRVWSIEDIQTLGEVPLRVLGVVPRAEKKLRALLEHISAEHKFDRVSESFSTLRGVLNAMECGSTLVVTSPAPGEGKTTCASNLAIGFAQAGHRTLLLDMDMRRPRAQRIWGIEERERSLLHALGDAEMPDFANLAHETDVTGLDIIVSHRSSRISPSEIIGQSRTRDFIEWARTHYDRVVIDSPPVGIAADAMLLGGMADGVLLIARFNRTRKRALGAAAEQLRDGKANILGVALNDVVFGRLGYGYRHPMYRYYSGYRAYSKYTVAAARASREEQA